MIRLLVDAWFFCIGVILTTVVLDETAALILQEEDALTRLRAEVEEWKAKQAESFAFYKDAVQQIESLRKRIAEQPDTKRLEAFFEADRYDVCPTLRKGMPNAFGHTWYFGYPNYHHRGSGNTPREAIDKAIENETDTAH